MNSQNVSKGGEYYLTLLGLGHLADEQIPGSDLQARDFLEICGPHALPHLYKLESMPSGPIRNAMVTALRDVVHQYLTGGLPKPAE